jgi:hypothetical protein
MSGTLFEILAGIKTDLETIRTGDTTDIQGVSYTFQTDIGFDVVQGLSLKDAERDSYPACSINGIVGVLQSLGQNKPEAGINLLISIEAEDRITPDQYYSAGCAMLEDIRAAVDLTPARHIPDGVPAEIIQPAGFEFLQPKAGSNIVLVRRRYTCLFVETYPYTD